MKVNLVFGGEEALTRKGAGVVSAGCQHCAEKVEKVPNKCQLARPTRRSEGLCPPKRVITTEPARIPVTSYQLLAEDVGETHAEEEEGRNGTRCA